MSAPKWSSFVGLLPLIVVGSLLVALTAVTAGSRAVYLDTTDNAGNSFTSSNCFDAQPGSVQSGTATSSANGVVSVGITAVDPTLSFLMFSSRHDSNRPVGSMIRGRLNGAGTAVEFERVTNEVTPVTMTMEWYVVTYTCGITVQRGEVSQASTTINLPISSVGSTAQAFVTWSKTPSSGDNTLDTNDPVLGELTSPTNLQFRVNSATAAHIIAWQVIAFDNPADVNVQTGTTSLLGTATSTTATLTPAVDVTKTFVLASYRTAGSGADIGARMLRAELTNSTTITFTRDISGTPDDLTEITWQAIELKEGSSVQRGTQTFAAATAQQNVAITPVDTNKAYAFGSVQAGSGQNVGRSSYAADDIIGVGSFTAELSTSQLTLTRDNTAAAANVGWFIVHWGSAPCVQSASVQSGAATSSANGVVSVAITPVDPTLSFLMFSSRHDSNRPVGSLIRGRLNGAGTAVEFERVTNEAVPVTMTMEWYVVTYTCGITVQRGEVAQTATTVNVPISSVGSTSQAFVTWSKTPTATDGTFNADDSVLGELTSPTNLQFRVNSANAAHIIAWQVIAFDDPADVNVQTGTTSLLGTATSTTATLTPAVDVTKTFVLASYRTAGSGADIGARMLRAELTNSTTITFTRDISGTPDDLTEITWQAIELKEGSSVQRGTQVFAAATAQQNVAITPVDTNKAYAFGSVQAGSGQNVGRSSYAADDIIGVGSFTAELSTSQLTLTRDNTAAAANVGWFIVHWGSAPPPAADLSGSVVPSATEAETVAGGETLVITLTNDTWDPTIGADNAKTTALINGIDSAQSEAAGWDAVVKTNLDFNDVTRTSNTVVTITLGAEPTYDITADETITVIVPATAVASGGPITATPTFDILAAVEILDSWTTGTTHTVSAGTSRLLLVGVYGEDSAIADSVNTVTWGGQTLTAIDEVIIGTGFSNIAWLGYLDEAGIAAATGNTIVVTWSGFPPDGTISYSAVTLENVNQTTPVGGSSTGTALSAGTVQPSAPLAVDQGDLAVYITVSGAIETHTAATGYTEGTEEAVGASGHVSATAHNPITGSGTEQPIANWSNTNNRLAIISTTINVK